jgi:hypothetical protein
MRIDLVVNMSNSGSGVAGSSPDAGTINAMGNILEQGVYSHGSRSTVPFIYPGSINWCQPQLRVKGPAIAGVTLLASLAAGGAVHG